MRKLSFSVRHIFLLFALVGVISGGVFYKTFEAQIVAALSSVTLNNGTTTLADSINLESQTTALGTDIGAYQWTVNGTNLSALNMPFDNSPTSQTDFSGGAHAGTVNGASPTTSGCQVGSCMSFDGNDYIGIPNSAEWNFTDTITISLWANRTLSNPMAALGVGGSNYTSLIWLSGDGATYDSAGIYIHTTSSTVYAVGCTPAFGTLWNGNWQHLVGVYNRSLPSNQLQFYINGTLCGSGTVANEALLGVGGNGIDIGRWPQSTSYLTGKLDEVQIYQRALSGPSTNCTSEPNNQICQLYANGTSGVGAPMVIESDETSVGEVWDLSITPITTAGVVGSPVNSSNTVTILENDVIAPVVSVLQPNGGESFPGGSSYEIQWSATDNSGAVETVDLEISLNGGSTYDSIPLASDLGNGTKYPFHSKFGTSGTAEGQFDEAEDIVTDSSGNIYVSDILLNRIQKFNSSGVFISAWGWGVDDGSSAFQICTSGCQAGISGTGTGQFNWPDGMAIDPSNNIYVVDRANHRVQKFDSNGNFLLKWGKNGGDGTSGSGNGEFNNPYDVALDSSGNVYVAESGRIQRFTSNGTYINTLNTTYTTYNYSIAVDSNGNVYTPGIGQMRKLDSNGDYLFEWGSSGTGNGQFGNMISGISVDAFDNVYVVDSYNERVQKFDSSGNFLVRWGKNDGGGSWGTGDGEFSGPLGIYVDSVGYVYVAEYPNKRVQKFSPGGFFSWTVPSVDTIEALIRATATDAALNSTQDASGASFTIATPPTMTLIQPNGSETLSAGSTYEIQWLATDNAGVDHVDLEYSANDGVDWIPVVTGEANDGSYLWTVPSTITTEALFLATAYDALNNSAQDDSDNWFAITAGVPGVVIDLSATAGDSQVSLTWSAPADNGSAITDYVVQYGVTSGFPGNAATFNDGVSSSTGATVTGLTNGTDYSFHVAAVNGEGQGSYSTVDTATPAAAAPPAAGITSNINISLAEFLSFSISNAAGVGVLTPAGDQPFGAGAGVLNLSNQNAHATTITGEYGTPVYTELGIHTNSSNGYNVTIYAGNSDNRTSVLLRSGGTPGDANDEISDSVARLAAAQSVNDTLTPSSDTGIAFRVRRTGTTVDIYGADEVTQWGDNDTTNALWASPPLGVSAAKVIFSTTQLNTNPMTALINWFIGVDVSQRSGLYSGDVILSASAN